MMFPYVPLSIYRGFSLQPATFDYKRVDLLVGNPLIIHAESA
jgi:hypothetical protein